MIDELVLEQLFADTVEEIPLPDTGMTRVIDELELVVREPRRASARSARVMLAAAAAVAVIVGAAVVLRGPSSTTSSKSATSALPSAGANDSFPGSPTVQDHGVVRSRATKAIPGLSVGAGSGAAAYATTGSSPSSAPIVPAVGAVDGAKIVKTGTLDLQVARNTLRTAVNRVSSVAVGLDGYIANSSTSYDGPDPTGQITMRVPVGNFESAIKQLKALPDVKVLGDSETGKDVTAQYTDFQAQLAAAQSENSAFLDVLSHATSIGDILAVRDRITQVQSEINQLQGQINLLNDKAAYSAIAVTLAERTVTAPTHVATAPSGLSKAWQDARQGFSNSVEWIIARSGGALIVFLAILVLLFGLRYLYPVVRRALL